MFSPFQCSTESATEDKAGQSEWGYSGANMEKPTILAGAHDNADRKTGFTLGQRNTPYTTERHDIETHVEEKKWPCWYAKYSGEL